VWEHILELDFPSATSVEAAFFYSTFEKYSDKVGIVKTAEGTIDFTVPVFTLDDKLAGFGAAEIGSFPPIPSFGRLCVRPPKP
jgi:hypothetical protein